MPDAGETSDQWSDFVLRRQHAGDDSFRSQLYRDLDIIRDRVLDGAKLRNEMTFADIGAGQGLLGFGAISRIGPSLRVIFTDISAPLLRHCRQIATERGVLGQCSFVPASAEKLDALATGAIDAIGTRASLMFVPDKLAALNEFRRVLKPGGRISLSEPICQDTIFDIIGLGRMIETQPSHPEIAFLKLLHRYRSAQYPTTPAEMYANPISRYSERDLVQLLREAGFVEIHLELHIDCKPQRAMTWEVFLDVSPHPAAPTLREIMSKEFTADERQLLETGLRPQIEAGKSVTYDPIAYITAKSPMPARLGRK